MPKRYAVPILAALMTGCAAMQPTLEEQGKVRIETQSTAPVSIVDAHAYRDGADLVVEATVKFPRSVQHGIFNGHINVRLLEPDGRTVKSDGIRVVPRRIPKSRGREAFFVARFAMAVPKGTVIRITYLT